MAATHLSRIFCHAGSAVSCSKQTWNICTRTHAVSCGAQHRPSRSPFLLSPQTIATPSRLAWQLTQCILTAHRALRALRVAAALCRHPRIPRCMVKPVLLAKLGSRAFLIS